MLQGPRGRLILGDRVRRGAGDRDRPGGQGLPAQPARGLLHLVHQRRLADRHQVGRPGRRAAPGDGQPARRQAARCCRPRSTTIAKSAQGLVDQTEGLDPPGALKDAQASLVTALEYRVTGLTTLASGLPDAAPGHRPADQGRRHRQAAAAAAGQRRDLRGLVQGPGDGWPSRRTTSRASRCPRSRPFLPNAALASAEGAKSLIPDLSRRSTQSGADASGNLRGTSLESHDRQALGHAPDRRADGPGPGHRGSQVERDRQERRRLRRVERDREGLVLVPRDPERHRHAPGGDQDDAVGRDRVGRDPGTRRRTRSSSAIRARW